MVKLDDKNFKPLWAVEIKWTNQFYEKPGDLKPLLRFLRDNNLQTALITTIDKEGTKEIDDLKLKFIPASVYAYTVGKNTILQSKTEPMRAVRQPPASRR